MASLKNIRKRIQSVEGICKITSAMSLVASSKLRYFQNLRAASMAYSKNLENLVNALGSLEDCPDYMKKVSGKKLWLIITTHKGFCGGFVTTLLKEAKKQVDKSDDIWIFGERGKQAFHKNYPQCVLYPMENKMSVESPLLDALTKALFKKLQEGAITQVSLLHAHMKNIMSYPSLVQQLFPLKDKESCVEIEPKSSSIIEHILFHYVRSRLYAAFMESAACEHAARMIAMDQATKNTKELVSQLKIVYNKERQKMITDELVEIISGAEALVVE